MESLRDLTSPPAEKEMTPLVKVAMPPREVLMPALERVLYSGMIGEGEFVYEFETQFSTKFGLQNVLAVNSGTAALHLAMLLAGVSSGSEVITTSMTAEPTNTTILQCGAHPVFADVDPQTGNLCPISVERSITEKTAAIVVVHYAGYPADISRLREIADQHCLPLIEDCAHALGAVANGKPIGTFGDFSIFSLQAIKHITTIDGGILVLKDPAQMDLARRLRWFGLRRGVPRTEIDITQAGYKYNMHNVAATIGIEQLKQVDNLLARHRDNGSYFDRELENIAGIKPAFVTSGSIPTYWIYTLLADDPDDVVKVLAGVNVSASKLHRPNHLHTVFGKLSCSLPGLEEFYRKLIHIPCGWWVETDVRESIVAALGRG